MNHHFWRGKRVFLTGHTGFKGSWLALALQEMGAVVRGFSLPAPTSPSAFALARVADGMQHVDGNILDLGHLTAEVGDFRPDVVFHLAAQALVRDSYAAPVDTYAVNVMGSVHLLEAVRRAGGVRAVVMVTSDKCYDNREWPWGYRENEAMGGADPYSSSKGCAELVTAAWRHSYFHPGRYDDHQTAIASVRAGNVIGGGDWAQDRLIPDFVRAVAQQRKVIIRNPLAVRPWQHVLAPLHGYMLLAEKLYTDGARYAEGWNFGPEDKDTRPVKWVINEMARLWEIPDAWVQDANEQPHEAHLLRLDSTKARSQLGWRPGWGLAEGLEATVAWYRAWLAGQDMRRVMQEQIGAYRKALDHQGAPTPPAGGGGHGAILK